MALLAGGARAVLKSLGRGTDGHRDDRRHRDRARCGALVEISDSPSRSAPSARRSCADVAARNTSPRLRPRANRTVGRLRCPPRASSRSSRALEIGRGGLRRSDVSVRSHRGRSLGVSAASRRTSGDDCLVGIWSGAPVVGADGLLRAARELSFGRHR
jgi:hypothetical protein